MPNLEPENERTAPVVGKSRRPTATVGARLQIFRVVSAQKLALGCLAFAIGTLFALQSDKHWFEVGHHGFLSSHGATLAKGLFVAGSPTGLMFERREIHGNGLSYAPYSRFPLAPFWLIGLVMRAFGGTVASEVLAARALMTACFALSLLVAVRVVYLLIGDVRRAVATVLLAFSSYHLLTYSDMIFNDIPALLGVVLGLLVVVHSEVRGFRPLWMIPSVLFSVSMGYQVCAVFGVWFLVRAVSVVMRTRLLPEIVHELRLPALMAAISGLTTVAILGTEIWNEWHVMGGALSELPSLRSARLRAGMESAESYGDLQEWLRWPSYLKGQLLRAAAMCSPWGQITRIKEVRGGWRLMLLCVLSLGFVALVWRGLKRRGRGLHWLALLTCVGSGAFWALTMRQFVGLHDFQSIYYVGLALAFFGCALLGVPDRALGAGTVLAMIGFVVSLYSVKMNKDAIGLELRGYAEECDAIRKVLPRNAKVFVDGNASKLGVAYHAINYCLIEQIFASRDNADFVLSDGVASGPDLLPGHRHLHLFRASSETDGPLPTPVQ